MNGKKTAKSKMILLFFLCNSSKLLVFSKKAVSLSKLLKIQSFDKVRF